MNPYPGEVWLAWGRDRATPTSPRSLVLYVPLTIKNRLSVYEVPAHGSPFFIKNQWPRFKGSGQYPISAEIRRNGSADCASNYRGAAGTNKAHEWCRDGVVRSNRRPSRRPVRRGRVA